MEYLSLSDVLKAVYGQKIYKLSLQSGCTCPNRDGRLGTGGCTFCSAGGSGDFAAPFLPVDEQIRLARLRVDRKIPSSLPADKRLYIAYFQSYTNTYGDTDRLRRLYLETIRHPEICILSVGTRPDCLDDGKIRMLKELNSIKPVWVELGLQTANDRTADHVHRGYRTAVFDDAYRRLKEAGLTVVVHVILGLPGEDREDMLGTIKHVADLFRQYMGNSSDMSEYCDGAAGRGKNIPVPHYSDGIKLQLLHVLRGTRLADEYQRTNFHILSLQEYAEIVVSCLKVLPPQTIVHRITGDGPKRLLIAPLWSADKKRVLNTLHKAIRET